MIIQCVHIFMKIHLDVYCFFFLLSICSLKKCRYVIMVNKLLKPTMKTSVHSHM